MNRSDFFKLIGMATTLSTKTFSNLLENQLTPSPKMPVLFIGHGSPMNIIEENEFTQTLKNIGQKLPKPQAILCISAHWLTRGTSIMTNDQPKMIYDMQGFPKELYEFNYAAPGAPAVAKQVANDITYTKIKEDNSWGFDHGNYAVMKHLFPDANIPLFQMSIDYYQPLSYHYELAQQLKKYRELGVLIVGSGNVTHNLRQVVFNDNATPFEWAIQFDKKVKETVSTYNHQPLLALNANDKTYPLAHPEPSHYLPLLYTLGVSNKEEIVSFPYEKIMYGSLSMRCIQFG